MFMRIRAVIDLDPLVWKVNRRLAGETCCRAEAHSPQRRVSMVTGSTVVLTADGMQQLHDDLLAYRERRSLMAEEAAASPVDVGAAVLAEFALANRRFDEIAAVLARAMPVTETEREPGVVGIGSRVMVRWQEDGDETYTIVDPAEVAPSAGRISMESPVGQALANRRAGDRVAVETLAGTAWLEVVAVG
jgi:transcription elongation factor GreA